MANHHFTPDEIWERIRARSTWDGGCLIWRGCLQQEGYGVMTVSAPGIQKRTQRTHRLAYEVFYGLIPDGLTIDHVKSRGCRSRACCNPLHLEAVTQRENTLRGDTVSARHAAKTHCPKGHPLVMRSHRQRWCQLCNREWQVARAARRKAAGICVICGLPSARYRCHACARQHAQSPQG